MLNRWTCINKNSEMEIFEFQNSVQNRWSANESRTKPDLVAGLIVSNEDISNADQAMDPYQGAKSLVGSDTDNWQGTSYTIQVHEYDK